METKTNYYTGNSEFKLLFIAQWIQLKNVAHGKREVSGVISILKGQNNIR